MTPSWHLNGVTRARALIAARPGEGNHRQTQTMTASEPAGFSFSYGATPTAASLGRMP